MALCSLGPSACIATCPPRRGPPPCRSSLEPHATSHKSHATSHKPHATSHKPHATSHKSSATLPDDLEEWQTRDPPGCQPGAAAAQEDVHRGLSGAPGAHIRDLRSDCRLSPGFTPGTPTLGFEAQDAPIPHTRDPGSDCSLGYTPGTPTLGFGAHRTLGAAVAAVALLLGCSDPSWALASRELAALVAASVPYDEAMENEKPTMLEFYADWCTICNDIAPGQQAVESEFSGQVNMVMLNIDNPTWAEEVEEFGVDGLPHFSFLDRQGNEEAYMVGRVSRVQMRENLQALAQGTTPLPHQFVSEDQSPAEARSVTRVEPRSHSPNS